MGEGLDRELWWLIALLDGIVDERQLRDLGRSRDMRKVLPLLARAKARQRTLALGRLRAWGLISAVGDQEAGGYTLHPVVRGSICRRLRRESPGLWRAAHEWLYRWTLDRAPKETVEYEDLESLYTALRHGLEAGLYSEAFETLVWKRLLQGYPALAVQKFSTSQRDLDAIRGFFDAAIDAFRCAGDQLSVPMARLYKRTCLLFLGRLDEALEMAEQALAQLRTEECDISVWARGTHYVMGTISPSCVFGEHPFDPWRYPCRRTRFSIPCSLWTGHGPSSPRSRRNLDQKYRVRRSWAYPSSR